MARNIFKSLAEYLQSSQREWKLRFTKEPEPPGELQPNAYDVGIACMEQGQYEEAIAHLKKATLSGQFKKDAYYTLADCYRQLNMIPLARKTYERLMQIDYNYKDIQTKFRELDLLDPGVPKREQPLAQAEATRVMPAEDRYQVLKTLHAGPRARVYKVQDRLLGRVIALKQVNRSSGDQAVYLRQMKERAVLDHPNILKIYDIDETQGQITMEYVKGRNLRAILRLKGALSHDMVIYIAIQLLNGLHQAHLHGIVHDALTPEHLLLTRQCTVKILGFRACGSFLNAPPPDDAYQYLYIPPEFFSRKELIVASNLYSVGIILYEMFTGRPPFTLEQVKARIAQPADQHYDESVLPGEVQPIIRRCLAISPEERYSTVRTVGEILIRWYQQGQHAKTHDKNMLAYKDFLLMAWADGKIAPEEAEFLTHKRKELRISDSEAEQAEIEVKQKLQQLLETG